MEQVLIPNYLESITETAGHKSNLTNDIDGYNSTDYPIGNPGDYYYLYDDIGNLVEDRLEDKDLEITWNNFGKIQEIKRVDEYIVRFFYDGMGNRVVKAYKPLESTGYPKNEVDWEYTHYVRDAQGTVIAVYKEDFDALGSGRYRSNFKLDEISIYDSERIGRARGNDLSIKNEFEAAFNNYRFDENATTTGEINFNPNIFYLIKDGETDDATFDPSTNTTGRQLHRFHIRSYNIRNGY